MKPASTPPEIIVRVVDLYGDLLYDLCASILWSPASAEVAFRGILQRIRRQYPKNAFRTHERAWVLQVACRFLEPFTQRHGRRLSPSEQLMLDANSDLDGRFRQFDSYLHRLPVADQILLLLRDKFGIPYSELATALGIPEGSLKLRRQQALKALEDWLWSKT